MCFSWKAESKNFLCFEADTSGTQSLVPQQMWIRYVSCNIYLYICRHETRDTDFLLSVVLFLPPREQERLGFAARGVPTYRAARLGNEPAWADSLPRMTIYFAQGA